ncbi:uncharacterized protein LOC106768488 isoform X2 [Vigna radiata var. radiata]|uniref:Uncharacterized protein LOC106768488 isoform X2 n=1 Tax=Vigna radiata var. radiata TaxID=3916 RepID=A0A3Q0F7G0_VIGRR|nr:uncharacterized protein LOC106768488 isoform X2 [Vigna radiata var. radiata]
MASSSDPSNQETVLRRKNNGPPIKFLIPLIYAPVLPLIRLTLRHKPVLRDRLFTAVLAGGFAHGFYLMYPFLDLSGPATMVRYLLVKQHTD